MPEYRPEDVTTITAYLTVSDGAAAMEFYKQAFGADERFRAANDAGQIEHATLRFGDATVYLSDELGGARSPDSLGASPVMLFMHVPDCDAVWERALACGATATEPLADKEWGYRFGQLRDPFGHIWGIGTMKPTQERERPDDPGTG